MRYEIPTPDAVLPSCRVLPVVVIRDPAEVDGILSAFRDGGVNCVEITFRTVYAAEAIRLAANRFPDVCIGAGTVLTAEQAECALSSGARFIVSPGFSEKVYAVCGEHGIPYLPGCVTPTEIMCALAHGITTVKFFPADVYGGLSAIRALSAPFPQVRFLPTGGVGFENLHEYLSFDRVSAVGGSFLCKGNIRENCRRLNDILQGRPSSCES